MGNGMRSRCPSHQSSDADTDTHLRGGLKRQKEAYRTYDKALELGSMSMAVELSLELQRLFVGGALRARNSLG